VAWAFGTVHFPAASAQFSSDRKSPNPSCWQGIAISCCIWFHSCAGELDVKTASAAGSAAVATADATADPADANVNTYFRSQDIITTTDASSEANVPGLAATDYKKVWRAMPNVEHWSPFITSVVPFLPSMKTMALSMRWHYPMSWPLAGPTGEHKDWLMTAVSVYGRAFLGLGPRPLVYPTILIPTHEVGNQAGSSSTSNSNSNISRGCLLLASRQLPATVSFPLTV
jgi:hypothetical protein